MEQQVANRREQRSHTSKKKPGTRRAELISESSESVRETHASAGLISEVDPNAEEVCWASGFTTLAANAIFGARGGSDLASLAAIPGDHLENIEGTGTHALSASDAGVVDLDGVGHALC